MLIYKIFRQHEWRAFEKDGFSDGSADDLRDGFIHFSKNEQLKATAERHFKGETDLWLIAVDEAQLGPRLKWEASRNNMLFPHFFGRLERRHVASARPFDAKDHDEI